MGRPKMTEADKAAAKAAREAAKAGAGAAADRAEARAAKTAKPATDAPKATAAPRGGNPELDREEQALFLQHVPKIKRLREAMNTANSSLRLAYKAAKAEAGFTKADFDTAFALETAEKEAKERAAIARKLKVAKWMGSALGNQLDMFSEPDRTPASDIAAEEGERDALQSLPARPKYDPSTEQYRKYMASYHDVSEKRIKSGIGKLHPEVEADVKDQEAKKAEIDAAKERDARVFAEYDQQATAGIATATPSSGVPLTRAQYKAQMEAQKADTKH